MEGGLGGLGAKVVDGGADLEEAETASVCRRGRGRVFAVGGIADVVVAPKLMPLPSRAPRAGTPKRACISGAVAFSLCLLDGTRESKKEAAEVARREGGK